MQQIPIIKKAKEQGIYVITCDYAPENLGHKFADEYHNVSTTDLDGVLELAKGLDIDGIVAYASDPAAPPKRSALPDRNLQGAGRSRSASAARRRSAPAF